MADRVSPKKRSYIMSRVKTKDTGPELLLRRALHKRGYRYRVNVKKLPGKPDIVFPSRRKLVFVHGCFWHGHDCRWGRPPKSNAEYWKPKVRANRKRDEHKKEELQELGWSVLEVWQCEFREFDQAVERVCRFLDGQADSD